MARKHSGCPVLEGDFENYDFYGMSVDAIVLVVALVNVPQVRFRKVFSNILQALKPGGHVLITLKQGTSETENSGGRGSVGSGDATGFRDCRAPAQRLKAVAETKG